jgi:hypothetical protein
MRPDVLVLTIEISLAALARESSFAANIRVDAPVTLSRDHSLFLDGPDSHLSYHDLEMASPIRFTVTDRLTPDNMV